MTSHTCNTQFLQFMCAPNKITGFLIVVSLQLPIPVYTVICNYQKKKNEFRIGFWILLAQKVTTATRGQSCIRAEAWQPTVALGAWGFPAWPAQIL